MTRTKNKNKLTKRALIISTTLVILSIFASVFYVYGIDYYRKYYSCATVGVDYQKYPVMGVDISSHQGNIDWQLVYDSKITFAFIKATEGETFVDKSFATNFKQAKEKNIIVGAYLFFKFNKDGKTQAQNYIQNVSLTTNDLPPVVDFEVAYGNRLRHISKQQVQKQLLKCLRELEKHYKLKPIIYTNGDAYNKYIKDSFDDYPLWLCKLCTEPQETTPWVFWQYTHKGSTPGIKGNVDLNVYKGTYTEFVNFLYSIHSKTDNTTSINQPNLINKDKKADSLTVKANTNSTNKTISKTNNTSSTLLAKNTATKTKLKSTKTKKSTTKRKTSGKKKHSTKHSKRRK